MWLLLRTETRSVLARWKIHLLLSAVLSVGLGVASTLASVFDSTVLRPVRVPTADRLVTFDVRSADAWSSLLVSPEQVRRLQADASASLTEVAGVRPLSGVECSLTAKGATISAPCATVTPGFFQLVGLPAVLHSAGDGPDPIVVGYDLWVSRLQPLGIEIGDLVSVPEFDPATFGTRARPLRVVGIAPVAFYLPGNAEFWITPQAEGARFENLELWALVRPGLSAESLQQPDGSQALSGIRALASRDVRAIPLRDAFVPDQSGMLFLLLVATLGLLFTLWCQAAAFLANEAMSQSRALGVRLALGASRGRLIAEHMIGPILVSASALLGSQLLAIWLHRDVMAVLPLMAGRRAQYDFTTMLVSAAVVVAFLAAQAVIANSVIATRTKQIRGEIGAARSRGSASSRFAAVSVAVSVIFLYASSVLAGGFYRTLRYDYGFDTRNLIVIHASSMLAGIRSPDERRARRDAIERTALGVPGVLRVARMDGAPFGGYQVSREVFAGRGAGRRAVTAKMRNAGPGVFATLGVPILAGRDFSESENSNSDVAIVTRAVSRALWPEGPVLGARLGIGRREYRVIGVVNDFSDRARRGAAATVSPQVFIPAGETSDLLVRASGNAAEILGAVLADVEIHRTYLRVDGFSYDVRRRRLASDEEAYSTFMGLVAIAAVLIAGLGAIVAVAQSCRQSLKDAAIRLGLGATHARVLLAVARAPLVWLTAGGAAGLGGGLLAGRALEPLMQNVRPVDGAAVAVCVGVMVLGVSVSLAGPARLLRRLDIATLLRDQR